MTSEIQFATDEQLTQIRIHAVNDITREIARVGIELTHEQADELGEETIDWMRRRLGLDISDAWNSVVCRPIPPRDSRHRYWAVAHQYRGTCDNLGWCWLSVRPMIIATSDKADEALDLAIAWVGHDSIHVEDSEV